MRKGRTPVERGTRTPPAAKCVVVMERDRISGRRPPPPGAPPPRSLAQSCPYASGNQHPGVPCAHCRGHISLPLDGSDSGSWDRTFRKLSRTESGSCLNSASFPLLLLSVSRVPLWHRSRAVHAGRGCCALGGGGPAAGSGSGRRRSGRRSVVGLSTVWFVSTAGRSLSSRLPWSPPRNSISGPSRDLITGEEAAGAQRSRADACV